MPSPQPGADNPRMCSAGTKAAVMANFARYMDMSLAGEIEPQSKPERMEYRADQIAEKELREVVARTAFFPQYEITGPHQPADYTDDRQKDYYGRFGAIRND